MTDNQSQQQKRVMAYIRKSSADNEQGEAHKQLNSLAYQRKFAREAPQLYNLKLVRKPFEDDKSGYEAFIRDGEDGFKGMLDYLNDKENHIDGIVCTEISRLARNFADGGMVLWYMQNGNIKNIYTPTKVFTNSSTDQLMVAIEIAMSKKSSDDTGYRTKEGMHAKVELMKHPSRPPVLGYKTEGPVGRKKWIIDEKAGPLVRQVFQQFVTGKYTFQQIADYAHNIGLKSTSKRSVTGKYSQNTWRNRLRDEHYIGIFYQDEIRIAGEYEPLIDIRTFYAVQEIIKVNEHPKEQHLEYAFSGLVRCSMCGEFLSGTNKKGITYYRCGKKKLPCKKAKKVPYLTEQVFERNIIEKFNLIEIDQKTWEMAREYVEELNQPQKNSLKADIRGLGVKIGQEKAFQIEASRKFTQGEITNVEHDRLLTDSYEKERSYKNSLVKCENIIEELNDLMQKFLEDVRYITRRFQTSLPMNKREVVEIFCENFVWDGKIVRFDWKKPYFTLAKQSNNSIVLRGKDSDLQPHP